MFHVASEPLLSVNVGRVMQSAESIVRTTDDMPNKLFMPLQINPPIIEKKSLNSLDNAMFLPPRTPRTIIHTSSLQKRRNSEVF